MPKEATDNQPVDISELIDTMNPFIDRVNEYHNELTILFGRLKTRFQRKLGEQEKIISTQEKEILQLKKALAREKVAVPWLGLVIGCALGILFTILATTFPAKAHQAPSGWNYPIECCHDQDCYEISEKDIVIVEGGYMILANKEIVPFEKVKTSPDGRYHRCSYNRGDPTAGTIVDRTTETICLFIPEKS